MLLLPLPKPYRRIVEPGLDNVDWLCDVMDNKNQNNGDKWVNMYNVVCIDPLIKVFNGTTTSSCEYLVWLFNVIAKPNRGNNMTVDLITYFWWLIDLK